MVLALHTLSICFGTGLNVWIFSKMFPKKENWCWKEILCEIFLGMYMLFIVLHNFGRHMPISKKVGIIIFWIVLVLLLRYGVERHVNEKRYIVAVNLGLLCVELGIGVVLLIWNSWNSYISVSTIIMGNFYMPFFLYRYFRCNLFQGYLWELLYEATTQILKGAYMVYVGGIENRAILEVNVSGRLQTVDAVVFGLVIYVLAWVMICYFNLCPILRKAFSEYQGRVFLLAMTEIGLLEFFTDLGMDGFDSRDIVRVLVITIVVVLVVLMLAIGMFKNSLEAEKRLLDVRNEAVEQQYIELRRAYEQNRCLIHDEKHRMQYIEECLENGDTERLLTFVKEYKEDVQTQARRVWTGLPSLDFVINMKARRIKELAIEFNLSAEIDSIPISDADIVVLLGNLFDNAIEATQKCSLDNRSIDLRMKSANEMFLLVMQNTSSVAPIKKKERFLTSKKEKENHGWGIESIRHIVRKYDGDIDITYDQSMFRVWIMINSR